MSFLNTKCFETDTDTFFRYQIFSKPIPILFFDTKIFRNRYRYFFRYQNFPKPIPILFSIPIFFETDTDTFFRYQKFSKPIPILFSIPKFFETDTDTIKKLEKFRNREVSKPKCHTLVTAVLLLRIFYPGSRFFFGSISLSCRRVVEACKQTIKAFGQVCS